MAGAVPGGSTCAENILLMLNIPISVDLKQISHVGCN